MKEFSESFFLMRVVKQQEFNNDPSKELHSSTFYDFFYLDEFNPMIEGHSTIQDHVITQYYPKIIQGSPEIQDHPT